MITIEELTVEIARQRDVLKRIEALIWYQPDDDDDLVEAVRVMACERDEAKDRARRACQLLAKEIGADEHQMHFGIRLDSYKTIADSWRAKVAEVEAERDHERTVANEQLARAHDAVRERDEARAEVERLRALLDGYSAGDE